MDSIEAIYPIGSVSVLSFLRKSRLPGFLAVCQHGQSLEIAHIQRDGVNVPRLLHWEVQELDNAGEMVSSDVARRLRDYRCTTLLKTGDYQLLQLDAPDVPEAEQKEALRWGMKDMLQFPAENAHFDLIPLPEAVMPGRAKQLFAAVTQESVVRPVIERFHAAGLGLEAIDLPEFALRNVAALFEDENRGLAFLVFGEQAALLIFTYAGELFSLRRIEVGSQQLLNANEERRAQLVERVLLELQRSIDGVDRQFSSISLSRMIVSLPADCGLEEQLRDGLYIPIESLDLAKVMDIAAFPELASLEVQRCSLKTIGAALRQNEVSS